MSSASLPLPHALSNGYGPEWASAWGQDSYGIWAEFIVKDVTQRLRWIPPGRFLMGSPESEDGHLKPEGPQQPIRIGAGYWLADSPCTQALWKAVTDENPSDFSDQPEAPVETVSFDDVQGFLVSLNAELPNLCAGLPSEAQWEYACRAGHAGPDWFSGQSAAAKRESLVKNYAWFEGNSGSKTQPVKQLRPNPWGLYDTLGNVWEWCDDGWQDSHGAADSEGQPRPAEEGGNRVLRGGSWFHSARHLRAADRGGLLPSYRDRYFGFRLSLVPVSPSAAEP